MSEMPKNLDKIAAHLRRLGRKAPEHFQSALTQSEIQSWESKLPFTFTREVEILYQWHNGTRAEADNLLEDLYMFPGFYFLSMEEAVEIFNERKDAPQWQEGWFPVFADGGGDFYIAPCPQEKTETSQIIGFLHGEPEQIAEYESLESMIQTLEACFSEGAFFIDDDNTMEIDDDKQREIAHRFNPGIKEWES